MSLPWRSCGRQLCPTLLCCGLPFLGSQGIHPADGSDGGTQVPGHGAVLCHLCEPARPDLSPCPAPDAIWGAGVPSPQNCCPSFPQLLAPSLDWGLHCHHGDPMSPPWGPEIFLKLPVAWHVPGLSSAAFNQVIRRPLSEVVLEDRHGDQVGRDQSWPRALCFSHIILYVILGRVVSPELEGGNCVLLTGCWGPGEVLGARC